MLDYIVIFGGLLLLWVVGYFILAPEDFKRFKK